MMLLNTFKGSKLGVFVEVVGVVNEKKCKFFSTLEGF
jgi:hypothetical protein